MKELVINNFKITDTGGEKNDPPYEILDMVNMYIEGGNIHQINTNFDNSIPVDGDADEEVRGGDVEFFRFNQDWLMRWFNDQGKSRVHPISNPLGRVTISGSAPDYTVVSDAGYDPVAMMQRAAFICPVGSGAITPITGPGQVKWIGLVVSTDNQKIVSAEYGGYIKKSANAGVTFSNITAPGTLNWSGVAGNAIATLLVACVANGSIWTSVDSGATWTERTAAGTEDWSAVCISEDGAKIGGVTSKGVYKYSVDAGATWITFSNKSTVNPSLAAYSNTGIVFGLTAGVFQYSKDKMVTWTTVSGVTGTVLACSADGNHVVVSGAATKFSVDKGLTFAASTTPPTGTVIGIAISDDGSMMYAAVSGARIYKSTDFGATWAYVTATNALDWGAICCSGDGTKVFAGVAGGHIFESTNSGTAFSDRTGSGNGTWTKIACSSTGLVVVAAVSSGKCRISSDAPHATWADLPGLGSGNYPGVVVSEDGTKIAVVISPGYVYISSDTGATFYSVTSIGSVAWTTLEATRSLSSILVTGGSYPYIIDATGVIINSMKFPSATGIRRFATGVVISSYTNGIYRITEGTTPVVVNINVGKAVYLSSSANNVTTTIDGIVHCVVTDGNGVYVSQDSGNSWDKQDITSGNTEAWWACAVSKDGKKILVTQEQGTVYEKISGEWKLVPTGVIASLLPAYGGSSTVFVANGKVGRINSIGTTKAWTDICTSIDGKILWACTDGGGIFKSTDGGLTWAISSGAGSRKWIGIACSSDGLSVSCADYGGSIYSTKDGGTSWHSGSASALWENVSISDDGKVIAAGTSSGIYISIDYGYTFGWNSLDAGIWNSVVSGDGSTVHCANSTNIASIQTFTYTNNAWVRKIRSYTFTGIDHGISSVYACSSEGVVLKSSDDGATWIECDTGYTKKWNSISVIPSTTGGGDKIFVASLTGIIQSFDGGTTWSILIADIPFTCIDTIHAASNSFQTDFMVVIAGGPFGTYSGVLGTTSGFVQDSTDVCTGITGMPHSSIVRDSFFSGPGPTTNVWYSYAFIDSKGIKVGIAFRELSASHSGLFSSVITVMISPIPQKIAGGVGGLTYIINQRVSQYGTATGPTYSGYLFSTIDGVKRKHTITKTLIDKEVVSNVIIADDISLTATG
jgi:hypothetical protein